MAEEEGGGVRRRNEEEGVRREGVRREEVGGRRLEVGGWSSQIADGSRKAEHFTEFEKSKELAEVGEERGGGMKCMEVMEF